MSVIKIPDPAKGVFTACDQDELPPGFALDLDNFYLDRPGKLRKRDGVLAYGSNFPGSGKTLKSLYRFVNKDLTGGAAWLSLWYVSNTGYIYVSNAAGSAWTAVETIGVIAADIEMRPLVIGAVLRMAFRKTTSPVWYGYIKRKFWHDLWDHSHTTPVWYDCDAGLAYPATWDYSSLTVESLIPDGLSAGHHFYKAVPVFDGGQEALLGSGKAYYEIESGTTSGLLLKMGFSDANWKPRITHIKIYRQINTAGRNDDDALYQLVKTVSTQNDPAVVTGTGDTMERKWYDPGQAWDVNEWEFDGTGTLAAPDEGDIKYTLLIASLDHDIASNTATMLVIDNGESEISGVWYMKQSYDIKKWTWSGAEWTDNGVQDSGTEGSGGKKAFYVSAASYEDDEFLHHLIKEQSTYKVILANNDKVICMNGDPTNNTGVALRIGEVMWDYSTPNATLRFIDAGLLPKGPHPLAGITSITAFYRYHAYFKGRNYVFNLAFGSEQYPDWVGFSEIDQPDVIPNVNFIPPDSGNGGDGMGIFALDKADALVVFYRHDIAYLNVPRADPTAWSKHEHEGDIGLITDSAIVRTPIGYFFCYDTGIYFMGLDGAIKGPVSFPIDDVYRAAVAAGSGSSFSAMYLSERRIVMFGLGTDTEVWALDIDSIFGEYPKWFKFPFGLVSAVQVRPERSAVDENGYFYMHQWAGGAIYRMNEALTGTEVFPTKLKTAYIRTGDMKKKHLVREVEINHKGSDNVTPKIYFDDGATSDTKTAITASAAGEDRRIAVKRRCRNVAVELTTPASATVDHEIHRIELEVDDG